MKGPIKTILATCICVALALSSAACQNSSNASASVDEISLISSASEFETLAENGRVADKHKEVKKEITSEKSEDRRIITNEESSNKEKSTTEYSEIDETSATGFSVSNEESLTDCSENSEIAIEESAEESATEEESKGDGTEKSVTREQTFMEYTENENFIRNEANSAKSEEYFDGYLDEEKKILEAEKSKGKYEKMQEGTAYAVLNTDYTVDEMHLKTGTVIWVDLEKSKGKDIYYAYNYFKIFSTEIPKKIAVPTLTEDIDWKNAMRWGFDPENVNSPLTAEEHEFDESLKSGLCQVISDNCEVITEKNGKTIKIPKGTFLAVYTSDEDSTNPKVYWYFGFAKLKDINAVKFLKEGENIDKWKEPNAGFYINRKMYLNSGDILHQPENAVWGIANKDTEIILSDGSSVFVAAGTYVKLWDFDESSEIAFVCWENQSARNAAHVNSSDVEVLDMQPDDEENLNIILSRQTAGIIY